MALGNTRSWEIDGGTLTLSGPAGRLARFGARPIPRKVFADHLAALVNSPAPDSAWVPLPASEVLG